MNLNALGGGSGGCTITHPPITHPTPPPPSPTPKSQIICNQPKKLGFGYKEEQKGILGINGEDEEDEEADKDEIVAEHEDGEGERG
ncbi:hypothetical protein ACFX13_006331 [Malus domestica]